MKSSARYSWNRSFASSSESCSELSDDISDAVDSFSDAELLSCMDGGLSLSLLVKVNESSESESVVLSLSLSVAVYTIGTSPSDLHLIFGPCSRCRNGWWP